LGNGDSYGVASRRDYFLLGPGFYTKFYVASSMKNSSLDLALTAISCVSIHVLVVVTKNTTGLGGAEADTTELGGGARANGVTSKASLLL